MRKDKEMVRTERQGTSKNEEGIRSPRGTLTFKAIKQSKSANGDRVVYVGTVSVYDLLDKNFVVPEESEGLSPEVLNLNAKNNGPVQRKTSSPHVQKILDYIVEQAEEDEPLAFNAIVLYTSEELAFETQSSGIDAAGEAQATRAFSVGEGLHRCLAWAVACDLSKVKGVRRAEVSVKAQGRIDQATIPVVVIEEADLKRQREDFNRLNQQKPLTATVMSLTEESQIADLTRQLIADVPLFKDRIDLNNASVGQRSDKLLSFSQLQFVVASYLLGNRTRSRDQIRARVGVVIDQRGLAVVQRELKETFTLIASNFGRLEELQKGGLTKVQAGDIVRDLRARTLLTSNAAWRALALALHDAKEAGITVEEAIKNVRRKPEIWARDNGFFEDTLINKDNGKLMSGRDTITAASGELLALMK